MLSRLLIKNYILIEKTELLPSAELNILTGETGAGKSAVLSALGLLLGNRADMKVLYNPAEKCVVEGEFDVRSYKLQSLFEAEDLDYDEHCTVRREISTSGKSRAFVNDTPVTLKTLKTIGERLVDIHSQHDTLLLRSDGFQRETLDLFAGNETLLTDCAAANKKYRKSLKILEAFEAESAERLKEFDYRSFLLEELDKAGLDDLNQEKLEQELELAENAEQIKIDLNTAVNRLSADEYSAENGLRGAIACLRTSAGYSEACRALLARLESVLIEITDVNGELENLEESLELDEETALQIRESLDGLYLLQKKHRLESVAELKELREDLRQKVEAVINSDAQKEELQKNCAKDRKILTEAAGRLSEKRKSIAPKLEKKIAEMLAFTGMPDARFQIELRATEIGAFGAEEIVFLFSANKGIEARELKNTASGGEFARLMLCLKAVLADKTALPTLVFDEIDTGVSGEIAIKVSRLIGDMAKKHQLFVISHLPQTAANGRTHFSVYKENKAGKAVSRLKKLDENERLQEIAQMIGGLNPGQTAVESARDLLGMYAETSEIKN